MRCLICVIFLNNGKNFIWGFPPIYFYMGVFPVPLPYHYHYTERIFRFSLRGIFILSITLCPVQDWGEPAFSGSSPGCCENSSDQPLSPGHLSYEQPRLDTTKARSYRTFLDCPQATEPADGQLPAWWRSALKEQRDIGKVSLANRGTKVSCSPEHNIESEWLTESYGILQEVP